MRLLLDTHVFLWWLQDDPRLGRMARRRIRASENLVYVSAASIWEVSIKQSLGRIDFQGAKVVDEIETGGFIELEITARHAWAAGRLPPHHADPFDRLLIAQARLEGLTLVTRDPAFKNYAVQLLEE